VVDVFFVGKTADPTATIAWTGRITARIRDVVCWY
jgi:hypothetical protein